MPSGTDNLLDKQELMIPAWVLVLMNKNITYMSNIIWELVGKIANGMSPWLYLQI